MSHKQRVSASLTALTVKQKVLPLHFLIPNNFHVTASTNLGGSTLRRAEDIVLSGLSTRKEFFVHISPAILLAPPQYLIKNTDVTNQCVLCPRSLFSTSKDVT